MPRIRFQICSTVLALYFLCFMQWLFFATAQSFLSRPALFEKLRILVNTPIIILSYCALPLLGLGLLAWAVKKEGAKLWLCRLYSLLPSFLLAAAFLLLLENFTYNLLGFNLFFFERQLHYAYAVIFLLFWVWSFRFLVRAESSRVWAGHWRKVFGVCLVFFALSAAGALSKFHSVTRYASPELGERQVSQARPSIFFIGPDMVPAGRMSAYGYQRETTPFLRSLAQEMLIAENALSNSNHSLAAILSLLTGRTPLETRVIHFPHLLEGEHSYGHLPGILKAAGYQSIEISERRYADAFDANMREGFDYGNYRDLNRLRLPWVSSYRELYNSREYYFFLELQESIWLRLAYFSGLRAVDEIHRGLWWPIAKRVKNDFFALEEVKRFIENHSGPYFVHLHMLGTHGPRFEPETQVFSAGQEQSTDYQEDFFDDAVLQFDRQLEGFIKYLKSKGLFDNSIIVVYSDHDPAYELNVRLPLMLRFPHGRHSGRLRANVQLIDVPVTVLDYLKLPKGAGLQGDSLLKGEPPTSRKILSLGAQPPHFRQNGWPGGKPPFRLQLGLAVCDKSYKLDFDNGRILQEIIDGHSAPCGEESWLEAEEFTRLADKELIRHGISDALAELFRY